MTFFVPVLPAAQLTDAHSHHVLAIVVTFPSEVFPGESKAANVSDHAFEQA